MTGITIAEFLSGDVRALFPENLETHTAVICAATDDNPVLSVTSAFTDHTGYQPGEIIGRNLRMLQGPETREEDVAKFRYAIANCKSASISILNYHKSGKPFMNWVELSPVLSVRGELECFAALQRRVLLER